MHPQLELLGVRIDNLSSVEAIRATERFLKEGRLHQIVTPGPEFLLEASSNPTFLKILNQSDLSLPDGMGLHVAALAQGKRLRERIPGADFVLRLMEVAVKHHARVFLYGGLPGAAEAAAIELLRRFPGLEIVGMESEDRGSWKKISERQVLERIHRTRPDILLVALGAPKQELWIYKHRKTLHRVRIAMGVGRTFDYLSGKVERSPAWVRKIGMEWAHTYLKAGSYYQSRFRRQRVRNATWNFFLEVIKPRQRKKTA